LVSATKDPIKVRAGAIGAERRWGPRRVVRLDQLDTDTARLIRALLAQKEAAPVVSETSTGTAMEVRRAAGELPAER
jgi:hypothetical protein